MTSYIRTLIIACSSLALAFGQSVSAQNPYEDHSERMYVSAPKKYSLEALENQRLDEWQTHFRRDLREVLGLDVIESQLRDFQPEARMLRSEDAGEFVREWWQIRTEPEIVIPFVLLRPKDLSGPVPLMITPHGHSPNSELSAGIYRNETDRFKGEEGERNIALQAVQHGFIAIAPTARGFGDTRSAIDKELGNTSSCRELMLRDALVGRTPVGDRVWDVMKIIDWALATQPVDKRNIIVSGNSGGGTVSLYAAAVDTRISMSLPGSAYCDFSISIGHRRHCECNYIPGIMKLGDMGEIAGLVAPRCFCAINGDEDPIFPISGAYKSFEQTRAIYEKAGAADKCSLYVGHGGHRYYKAGAWDFILSHLDAPEQPTSALAPWQKGNLDIHFISTGGGNSIFFVLPDGTTMLVDAGDVERSSKRAPLKPDESRSVGEWIADYIRQFAPEGDAAELDYALVTHYHDDHIGSASRAGGRLAPGGYPLSGITEVGTLIPFHTLIDRGDAPWNETLDKEMGFYRDFVTWQSEHSGMRREEARVGSTTQISLLKAPSAYPDFKIRILCSNGNTARKKGEGVGASKFKGGEYPGENALSVGFRLDYGDFSFYQAGDISGIGHTGGLDKDGMESRVAKIVGPVDVAVLDHHGNRDTQNEMIVKALSPRVWIGLSWAVRHPGEEVIRRITSRYVYPGDRDIYATYMSEVNKSFLDRYTKDYKSTQGHIVVRVAPGGASYEIYVLDDSSSSREVVFSNCYESKVD